MEEEQQHPQANKDNAILDSLMTSEISDRGLAELGRLIVRYRDFPGAKDIQKKLQTLLTQWKLTEETLFEKTRAIHSQGTVYRSQEGNQEDWF
ncbi:DUF3288 family protein [Oxynema aestuarii]|jgi:hypothetical protein|uniref:DUF3288 family protein n=1 Tax=Oxynema aestuarii AP17 TaxID=2064643 RepID=A0A6H1TX01_9CYAN|nr:DUF3288 family protein [Oxynema aestuarii]QIZ71148.1 DUF3288 family protein [Oxynema aestuarii AP17]RMH76941.1 MAG: DUF3288 family protein [Cyanobacteria bacterium J007]